MNKQNESKPATAQRGTQESGSCAKNGADKPAQPGASISNARKPAEQSSQRGQPAQSNPAKAGKGEHALTGKAREAADRS